MPVLLEKLAQKGEYDAIIALGAVIRGVHPALRLCGRGVR